jgi:hypothetical protein
LRRLFSGEPHQIIGGPENPYMLRWYVIPRNPVLNVYVHKFLRSDDDRALHDHPWWFVSLILRGRYDEVTEMGVKRRQAGSVAYRPAEWRHRVRLVTETSCQSCEGTGTGYGAVPDGRWMETDCGVCDGAGEVAHGELSCWTLIVTGRRARPWGFWCTSRGDFTNTQRERFVPWQEFGDAGCGEDI